ncbi:putative D-alanine from undecaprenylphosphate to the polyglycerolphosphate chain for lipoteichoic acid and wall teichoic acid synthesis [Bacillus altitudinis]|uniref:Protein DltD n=1 Tax=Bacillus altitudinis TaxID=293387 RepID=A0A653U870_BACAB|nr:D-alanyl-lipoteichoic acid biosynthesis protein DltD [Bacillus altitudinis]VXB88928.1 putative D-alanine from undecaprenylphosphate to the polyglycerolphosphate chain for lipoteichoic acid and wall teichoic acid synthesis [Bacillus altitudinis]
MKKRFFGPLILAAVLFIGVLLVPNVWLSHLIPKDKLQKSATELDPGMFQGLYLQDEMLKDPTYLPIYGSSELSRFDPYHPSNFFHENPQGFTPYLVGKGGSQSLIHAMNFAAHMDELKGKKLVFIVSPQWFVKGGSDENHFAPNYSALQALDLAYNKEIDPAVKKKLIKRIMKFKAVKNDMVITELFKAELSGNKFAYGAISPIAKMYYGMLQKKDMYYTIGSGHERKHRPSPSVKGKTWTELEKEASVLGSEKAGDNPFYIDQRLFDRKLKPIMKKMKDSRRDNSYAESPEYKDFQIMLDILKQAGAKPLFVTIPVNGKWYDYTGFPKEGRTDYYQKINRQIRDNGYEVADLTSHEYDPYFFKDTIHVSYKGWVYIDKAIEKFYKEQ